MPRIRQSSRKSSDMKFVPLSLYRQTGQPTLVIPIPTEARALVCTCWIGMPTAACHLLNGSSSKRMSLHPSETGKNSITTRDTCQKGWLGCQVVRLCVFPAFLLFSGTDHSYQPISAEQVCARPNETLLDHVIFFLILKCLLHGDSWSRVRICGT